MANSKRARSGKPPTQPRGWTYTRPDDLQSALERIRQAARLYFWRDAWAFAPEVGAV